MAAITLSIYANLIIPQLPLVYIKLFFFLNFRTFMYQQLYGQLC